MKMSIQPSEQKTVRHAVVRMIRSLGVDLNPEKEHDVMVVVGESIANCQEHGNDCFADISVAVMSDKLIVTIEASCYNDPKKVEKWFDREDNYADIYSERGHGLKIIEALSDVKYGKGRIDFDFSLAPVAGLAEPQMATA